MLHFIIHKTFTAITSRYFANYTCTTHDHTCLYVAFLNIELYLHHVRYEGTSLTCYNNAEMQIILKCY